MTTTTAPNTTANHHPWCDTHRCRITHDIDGATLAVHDSPHHTLTIPTYGTPADTAVRVFIRHIPLHPWEPAHPAPGHDGQPYVMVDGLPPLSAQHAALLAAYLTECAARLADTTTAAGH